VRRAGRRGGDRASEEEEEEGGHCIVWCSETGSKSDTDGRRSRHKTFIGYYIAGWHDTVELSEFFAIEEVQRDGRAEEHSIIKLASLPTSSYYLY